MVYSRLALQDESFALTYPMEAERTVPRCQPLRLGIAGEEDAAGLRLASPCTIDRNRDQCAPQSLILTAFQHAEAPQEISADPRVRNGHRQAQRGDGPGVEWNESRGQRKVSDDGAGSSIQRERRSARSGILLE